ncbi:MAG: hypothetical protein NTV34_13555 [Proteobacteria bacterium]|nr:hypothetical protein [Pseudomonadota bacterium]
MSEYQYYEFRSIDRPLNEHQMQALRAISTRARITQTSFTNTYNFGDFKGHPKHLMEKYFDAFLYVANWGTHRLMWRLPRHLINKETLSAYCKGECVSYSEKGDYIVTEFNSDIEPEEWEEGSDWLFSLMPLRSDLLAGDYRSLYLAWLCTAQCDELDDDIVEPQVPPGLGDMTGALRSFAEFLRIDEDLIAVASEGSSQSKLREANQNDLKGWIKSLSDTERNNLLLEFMEGKDLHLRSTILQQIQRESMKEVVQEKSRRTVGELLKAANELSKNKSRIGAEQMVKEEERKAKEVAVARAKCLDGLAEREANVWRQVDTLIEAKKRKEYEQAVALLKDLKDLGIRKGTGKDYKHKSHQLLERHANKHSFIKMTEQVNL